MDLKKLIKENLSDENLMKKGSAMSENFKNKAQNVGSGIINIIDLFFDAMSYAIVKGSDQKTPMKSNLKPVATGAKVSYLKPQQDISQAFYTNVSDGQLQPMRKGDSIANILAKMFNFMKKIHGEEIKEMEVSRNLAKRGKYTPMMKEKTDSIFSKFKKDVDGEDESDSFLKKLLTGLAAAALAIAGVYAALKGLLDPFINIFNNIKIPELTPLPVFNPFGRTPGRGVPGRGNAGRGNVIPTEEDERQRMKLEEERKKSDNKTKTPTAPTGQVPNEEPQTPTPSTSTGTKPGFLDTAEDKIRQRATRLAATAGAKGTGMILKEGIKQVGKQTLKRFLGGPFALAITAYDVADALAPSEKEALDTHVETLMSIEDDVDSLQKKYEAGEITGEGFKLSMKQKMMDAKTVEEKIRVLKKKAEDEAYKEEARLNQQAAEDAKITMADEVKDMGRDAASAVHPITKAIKDAGKRAAINYKRNLPDGEYEQFLKKDPKESYFNPGSVKRHLYEQYDKFNVKKFIREDPLSQGISNLLQENNDLNLKSTTSPISYIDNSKTNNMGGGTGGGGLTVASSAPVRNLGFDTKFLNDRFA
jgi:hypothetical protein